MLVPRVQHWPNIKSLILINCWLGRNTHVLVFTEGATAKWHQPDWQTADGKMAEKCTVLSGGMISLHIDGLWLDLKQYFLYRTLQLWLNIIMPFFWLPHMSETTVIWIRTAYFLWPISVWQLDLEIFRILEPLAAAWTVTLTGILLDLLQIPSLPHPFDIRRETSGGPVLHVYELFFSLQPTPCQVWPSEKTKQWLLPKGMSKFQISWSPNLACACIYNLHWLI